jgi:segregation and condensation protein A
MSSALPENDLSPEGVEASLPVVVDNVAVARLYGEPLFSMPRDLYIPPDALEVFLEAFEGPLDLLLYLIRKQNFNILDIPMWMKSACTTWSWPPNTC